MDTDTVSVFTRAGSGISGSRVPENWLGYPNLILSTGTRKIALWEVLNIKEIYKMIEFKCVEAIKSFLIYQYNVVILKSYSDYKKS